MIVFFLPCSIQAQLGCTDLQATNYDSTVVENDGSCEYEHTFYDAPVSTLLEAYRYSGMEWIGGNLWMLVESDDPLLHRINPEDGRVVQVARLMGFSSRSLQAITADSSHIYIGDFGNFSDTRQDLAIYKFPKGLLELATGNDTLEIEQSARIDYKYADQTNFEVEWPDHAYRYDCEAFFHFNDSLYLFTQSNTSPMHYQYVVPDEDTPGVYEATIRDSMKSQGLIFDAAISPSGKEAVLLGVWGQLGNFMWVLHEFTGTNFFSGNKRYIGLDAIYNQGILTAVTYDSDSTGYFSNIAFDVIPPTLYHFETSPWNPDRTGVNLDPIWVASLQLYPNPTQNQLFVEGMSDTEFQIVDMLGHPMFTHRFSFSEKLRIQVKNWPSGIYGCYWRRGKQLHFQQLQVQPY